MIQDVRPRGFTLFELLVVLVIISLTMALVTPHVIHSVSNLSGKTAARSVGATLRYARSRAVAEKVIYRAVFDTEARRVAVIRRFPDDSTKPSGDSRTISPVRDYQLPEGVWFEKGENIPHNFRDSRWFDIAFFPGGGASGGTVIVVDPKERRVGLSVDVITGGVKMRAL